MRFGLRNRPQGLTVTPLYSSRLRRRTTTATIAAVSAFFLSAFFAPLPSNATEIKDAPEDLKIEVAGASAEEAPASVEVAAVDQAEIVRTDFANRGFQYFGMTTVNGRASASIRKSGWVAIRSYRQGDIVEGYKLQSVAPDHVIFEAKGTQIMLDVSQMKPDNASVRKTANAAGRLEEATDRLFSDNYDLAEEESDLVAAHGLDDVDLAILTAPFKQAEAELKSRSKSFNQASVIRTHGFLPDEILQQTLNGVGRERFIMPMTGKITSRFGYRKRPTGGARRYHRGVDIAAPYGTPIRAAASGQVVKVSRSWAKGLYVEIKHTDGYATAYFHLHKAAVKPGWSIAQGEIIGYEGNSGQSTGPHLHFEILKNGEQVNPALFLAELGG